MRILYVTAPRSLVEPPPRWNHDVVLELAAAEEKGHTLGFIDNAMQRLDVEALASHAQSAKVDKIIVYGGLPEYRFVKAYVERLKSVADTVVRGFPEGLIEGLPVEKGVVPPDDPDELPCPNWGFLPLPSYWQNSPLPWDAELASLQRRATYRSTWGDKARSPAKVAEDLRHLRLLWFYDFLELRDDLTLDLKRSQALLDELIAKDLEGLFYWSCTASPERVSKPMLSTLKKSGLRGVDYGSFDPVDLRDPKTAARLDSAINAAKSLGLHVDLDCEIGDPETTRDDLVAALSFLKSMDLPTRPELAQPYPGTRLREQAKDFEVEESLTLEQALLSMNEGLFNMTRWSDAELLGIVELMARGDLARLDKVRKA